MKYTVITGASSGIGYETALAFASRGKNLIIVARRSERLEELKSVIQKSNPDLDVVIRTIDLSVADQAYTLYNSLKAYQKETWINNAGIGETSSVTDQNLDKVETMLRLNIESLTILSTLFVRDYSQVKGTQLINVSSTLGYAIAMSSITYSASKYFVSAFTEGLAKELEQKGAKMNVKVLAPAVTKTEFMKHAMDRKEFDYKANLPMYHTAKQMAGFMMELYDSNKVVGIVGEKYKFHLRDQIYPILDFSKKQKG
jgi:short-subunit dehydrogenase